MLGAMALLLLGAIFCYGYTVKQYVGKVNCKGRQFTVLMTGNPKYYLFCQLDPTGQFQTGLHIPIAKKNLVRDWKKYMAV